MTKFEVIEDRASQKTAVVVLGAGGPAAPAVADLLAILGCDPPKSERYGTSKLAELNQAILESSGTESTPWASFNSSWLASPKATEFQRHALDLLQSEFGGSYLAVFHDAETARLLPFWNLVFDRAGVLPRYVLVVSDPAGIADELHEGVATEPAAAHLAWLRAALDAEGNSRGRLRAFVHAVQLNKNLAGTANGLAESLKLVFPRDIKRTFASDRHRVRQVREQLRRGASGPDVEGPVAADWVTATHQTLKHWASHGEDAEGRLVLDAIHDAFDEAIPVFLGVGHTVDGGHADVAPPTNARLQELQQELENARTAARIEATELRQALDERTQALEEAQEQLSARYSEIVTLTRMLATETAAARKFERNANRLGAIAQAFDRGVSRGGLAGAFDWLVPWRWKLRQIKRSIEREGLFNSSAYLNANLDVQSAGADPLRHYLAHGASEGRPLGID